MATSWKVTHEFSMAFAHMNSTWVSHGNSMAYWPLLFHEFSMANSWKATHEFSMAFCPYEFPWVSHGNSMVCWSLLFHEFSMALTHGLFLMTFPWYIFVRGGGCAPFGEGQVGPHLTQSGQGRVLPACEVSPSSIQPFGHNTPTLQTFRQDNGPIA